MYNICNRICLLKPINYKNYQINLFYEVNDLEEEIKNIIPSELNNNE